MFIYITLAIIIGCISGIFTGLIPGLHVNLVTIIAVSLSNKLSLNPVISSVYILSLAVTHSFLDAIPGIYLGAPDSDQALNVLPGHRYLMKGGGHFAYRMTLIGSYYSSMLSLLLLPLFIILINLLYPLLRSYTSYLLIGVSFWLIFIKSDKKILSLLFFLASGILGYVVLDMPLEQPLLPLLSGLFGLSLLIVSLGDSTGIPEQSGYEEKISMKNIGASVMIAVFVGFIAAFLPGLGSSQAAVIGATIAGDIGDTGFMSMVGGINSANMVISVATAYSIEKARNGAIMGMMNLIDQFDMQLLLIYCFVILCTCSTSVLAGLYISKKFSSLVSRFDYNHIVYAIIALILGMSIYFDQFFGFIILLTSTSLGIASSYYGVAKSNLMGCLIVPVIVYLI